MTLESLKYKKHRDANVNFWHWLIWGRSQWCTTADWYICFLSKFYEIKLEFVVTSNFITDGGTIPRIFWWYVTPWNRKWFDAYVLHDYLLKKGCNRQFADVVFYDMLLQLGCPDDKALTLFYAVRRYGIGKQSNKNKKN